MHECIEEKWWKKNKKIVQGWHEKRIRIQQIEEIFLEIYIEEIFLEIYIYIYIYIYNMLK